MRITSIGQRIALDYDDTFTRDPEGWYAAMLLLKQRGAIIYGVTMRYKREASGMDSRYNEICERIYFTGRKAKRNFMYSKGITIDVWIDDNPIWIEVDAAS